MAAEEVGLEFEREFEFPPAIVFDALIDPELIAGWLGDADVEPQVGGCYDLVWLTSASFPPTRGTITMLDEPNARERYGYRYPENVAKPLSTTLVLSVVNRWDQQKKPELSWSDKPEEKLEQQITEIVVGAIMFADRRPPAFSSGTDWSPVLL